MFKNYITTYTGNKYNEIKNFIDFIPNDGFNVLVEPFGGSFALCRYFGGVLKKEIDYHVNDYDPSNYFVYTNPNKIIEWSIQLQQIIADTNCKMSIKECYEKMQIGDLSFNCFKNAFSFRGYPKKKCIIDYSALVKFMNKNINFTNDDFNITMNKFKDNEQAFIFLDPPYFDSCNTFYYSNTGDDSVIFDSTKIFIDILDHLKTAKCKIMLIINKNSITEFIYKDFIKGEYDKLYQLTKRNTKHLIICNY